MTTAPPVGRIILVRHGPTPWSRSGQHTGRTNLALDEEGRVAATALAPRLEGLGIVAAYTSPLRRAADTATLAGFPEARPVDDLMEWDYGEFEGLTTAEIRAGWPGVSLFRDGSPGGENIEDVERRCCRFLDGLALDPTAAGAAVVFSHGHLLRVLTAVYLGLGGAAAARFVLDTASVSVLGFERETRALRAWNT